MTEVDKTAPEAVAKRGGVSIVKRIFLVIVLGIVAFVGFVAIQPADFQIVRSTTINAPAKSVFPHVNDFHQWDAWSPWAKLDPAVNNTFGGPALGKDAVFSWDGNDKVGEGRMTILESRLDELVKIKLEFIRPFEDTSTTEFTFKPDGEKTVVTWSMSGHKGFVNKAVCLFMNMDKIVGGDFEKGLASMKSIVEANSP